MDPKNGKTREIRVLNPHNLDTTFRNHKTGEIRALDSTSLYLCARGAAPPLALPLLADKKSHSANGTSNINLASEPTTSSCRHFLAETSFQIWFRQAVCTEPPGLGARGGKKKRGASNVAEAPRNKTLNRRP